jgi:hypothetical protein
MNINRLALSLGTLVDALLECEELLRPECLVVDLGGGLDEVLQVGAKEEVADVDKLAVGRVFDVDNSPSVFASTNGLAVNQDVLF